MAKINNSAVMQKLIDELQLYPGKDIIPTELAEKILAVYQVNSQEVSIKTPTANVVKEGVGWNGGTTTIYTTPATGKFYLTNVSLAICGAIDVYGDVTVTINGTATAILKSSVKVAGGSDSMQFNLQNPILIDKATNITTTAGLALRSHGQIVGYTEAEI